MRNQSKIDKKFLLSVLLLTVVGFFIFISSSLGILTRSQDIFIKVTINQFVFGLLSGLVAMTVVSLIPYKFWKKYAIVIFIFSVILTCLVFVPGIGWRHGGALRWIEVGGYNFQPSEALKIAYLMILAYFFSRGARGTREGSEEKSYVRYKLVPFFAITAIIGLIFLLQPDNDTFFMTALAGGCMFFVSGLKARDFFVMVLISIVGIAGIFYARPYVRDRVMTFINPAENSLSSGYQIQQSLIAIGSGGPLGKGFGQSTQKFGFLPEPTGDSIFAVAGEEFGLLGTVGIVLIFLFFTLRGLKIATKTEDEFGRLLTVGIVILVVSGSFINIASMLGLIPLSGTPLLFISHGGSALFLALAEVGIILNISKYRKLKED